MPDQNPQEVPIQLCSCIPSAPAFPGYKNWLAVSGQRHHAGTRCCQVAVDAADVDTANVLLASADTQGQVLTLGLWSFSRDHVFYHLVLVI